MLLTSLVYKYKYNIKLNEEQENKKQNTPLFYKGV